jgi:ABC-2 type transport system permease protein
MGKERSNRWLQPRRVGVIAMNTFTQLVRMKVFYFLMIFSLIALAAQFLDLPIYSGVEAMFTGELRLLKQTCMSFMKLFAVVFSISATALLLPKDVEDRTLYTILAKPVPRLDYLVGKLLGVLLLIFVSLAMMSLLMNAALSYRTGALMESQTQMAMARGWSAEAIDMMRQEIQSHGVTWSLQGGVLAIFLQAAILAAAALLFSTFSTSTLFTIIVSFMTFFVGYLQADASEYYRVSAGENLGTSAGLLLKILALIFPNYQIFNVTDAAVLGQTLSLGVMGTLAGLTLFYVVLYTLLSWFVFSDKEF